MLAEARRRIGDSDWHAGLRYLRADTRSRFDLGRPEEVPERDLESTIAGLALVAEYDDRDTIFTPEPRHAGAAAGHRLRSALRQRSLLPAVQGGGQHLREPARGRGAGRSPRLSRRLGGHAVLRGPVHRAARHSLPALPGRARGGGGAGGALEPRRALVARGLRGRGPRLGDARAISARRRRAGRAAWGSATCSRARWACTRGSTWRAGPRRAPSTSSSARPGARRRAQAFSFSMSETSFSGSSVFMMRATMRRDVRQARGEHALLHREDARRVHREVAQPEAQQQARELHVARHLAAHRHRLLVLVRGADHARR